MSNQPSQATPEPECEHVHATQRCKRMSDELIRQILDIAPCIGSDGGFCRAHDRPTTDCVDYFNYHKERLAKILPTFAEDELAELKAERWSVVATRNAAVMERDAALARLSALEAKDWRWFGCASHFIGSSRCRFHLHTRVGNYRISTIGEMVIPGRDGFEEVGLGRLYETMVFRVEDGDEDGCPGEGHVTEWSEVASDGYNTWQDAHRGHLAMCERFAILTRDEGGEDAG